MIYVRRSYTIEVADSRSSPTVKATVALKATAFASKRDSPKAAQAQANAQALELRDKDKEILRQGVLKAVENIVLGARAVIEWMHLVKGA